MTRLTFNGPCLRARLRTTRRSIGFVGRKDPIDLDGFKGLADYYEPFKKYLMDGRTCNCSPHKIFGCELNDVIKQLRMRRFLRR